MDKTLIRACELISNEVRNLQKRFSYAYSDAVSDEMGKTMITLDLEDLNIVLFVLEKYQKTLQEVIRNVQNKEQ